MKPPRLADSLLKRVLPLGKRGESIRGDLLEEFQQHQSARWYWQQTIRLSLRYGLSGSSQQQLTYPRSNLMWFELSSDLKTALRNFRRAPGTSALIVLTLAFAIGAATVGFAFADLALLRGLPVDDASKVVSVFSTDQQGSNPRARVSGPDFLDYVSRLTTLEKMAAMRDGRAPLIRHGQSQTLAVAFATADVFASMGQPPLRGRGFTPGDDRPGAAPVVVLAHRFWQSEFNSREDIVGQTLQIGRDHCTVVGIMSPAIEFGNLGEADVWMPLRIDPESPRDARNLRFFARLKDGVPFEQAAAEMSALGASLAGEHPRTNGGWSMRLVPVGDLIGNDSFWVVITLFMVSIAMLMAVATANVSNLVLVRTLARGRELAVRTALGARKGRLVRQFVTEGFVLSFAAAALSLVVAQGGLRAIQALSPEQVFRQLSIDGHELSFVALLALICPLLFSISPIRMMSRPDMRQVLSAGGGRGATASHRGRRVLVALQVAFAVILLTVSTLALRSMQKVYSGSIGLDTGSLAIFGLEFNDAQYPSVELARASAIATRDALAGVPGVESVAMLSSLPVLGDTGAQALTIDNQAASVDEARPTAVVTFASPGADRTMGLRMLSGAWWSDGAGGVAVINEAAARRYFGGIDQAIGRFVSLSQNDQIVRAQVVGVSSDVANTNRTLAAPGRVWLPLDAERRRFAYLVRGANPAALISQVRTVVAGEAPVVAIEYLSTFDDELRRAESSDYVVLGMLGGFALLALVLASAGLFGVVSYAVAQRTAEFGTRMALGASARDVVRLVARDSVMLLVIGLAIGLAGGIGIASMMDSVLYGLSPADPPTLAVVIALLSVVTLAATALPAWRASRIDPVVALRSE